MKFEQESNKNQTGFNQGSNGVRLEIEPGKRKKIDLPEKQELEALREKEKKLIDEVMALEFELGRHKQYKYLFDKLNHENKVMRQELEAGIQPLQKQIATFEEECEVCMNASVEKITDLQILYGRAIDKNKKLIEEIKELKRQRDEGRGMYSQWKEVNELKKQLECKEAEIEKLKRRIGSSGRQPITQIQIDKILEYHEKGYAYRSIAYHAGCSTSTVSKYIAMHENK